ncbi:MAG: hypothetical protein K2H31_09860, partial [Lachnospiraceae bacterium]|nr:hypothetical protein [Lachnospiraceae bacterium]
MKKQIVAGIAVLAVIVTVFFAVLTGSQFLEMMTGTVNAGDNIALEEMDNRYIIYNVADPILTYAEEYYSGDPSRVSKWAYIIYDEERQTFLKIVIPERRKSKRSIDVKGSLILITDTAEIRQIQDDLQKEISEDDEEILNHALSQTKWYVLEDGYVGGISAVNLWICAVTVFLNVIFFIICLFSLLSKNNNSYVPGSSSVEQLLNRQRIWLEPWCKEESKSRCIQGVLWIVGAVAVMTVIGFVVNYPIMYVLTLHLPIGLCIGELCGVTLMLGVAKAFNPNRILKEYQKNLKKEVTQGTDLNAISEELLRTEAKWTVKEKSKEQIRYGILGERYWILFREGGLVRILDSDQIAQMKSEKVSGQVRSGRV